MKKLCIAIAALAMCFTSCKEKEKHMTEETTVETDTLGTQEPEIMEEEPMDSIAMQKAWEEYMTPGEPHKMMAEEVGSWNNEMSFWMDPNGEPTKATSTANVKMILGGRYQEINYEGTMMGMPFEGKSMLAYDNATNEFVSTWIDNMGTGLMVMRGTYDEASKSSTMTGSMVDPATGKEKNVREVYTIVDDNTRKMEMFEKGPNGNEFKTMEIMMTRK